MNLSDNTYVSFYLKEGKVHVFCDAVRSIGEPHFIRFLLNKSGTSMIMEPYDKKEFQSIRVPKSVYSRTGKMEFRCKPFCRLLEYALCWDGERSYRIPGRIIHKQHIILFDLTRASVIQSRESTITEV